MRCETNPVGCDGNRSERMYIEPRVDLAGLWPANKSIGDKRSDFVTYRTSAGT